MPYSVVLARLDGVEIDEVPTKNLMYGWTLNGPGFVNFTMPLREPKATPELLVLGARQVHVYRTSTTRQWGGYLWDDDASIDEGTVRFSGQGYHSRLRRRYIDSNLNYSNTNQETIAWSLIAFTQAKAYGNLGITRGNAPPTGVSRSRRYQGSTRRNLGEAIEELAEAENGFDFDIDPYKVWRSYYPKKGTRKTVTFEVGKNVQGFGRQRSAYDASSEITGQGASTFSIVTERDQDALNKYGLLQAVEPYKDINNSTTIRSLVREQLRLAKDGTVNPNVSVHLDPEEYDLDDFEVGDEVILRADVGYLQHEDYHQIISINVEVSNEGREAVTLGFNVA